MECLVKADIPNYFNCRFVAIIDVMLISAINSQQFTEIEISMNHNTMHTSQASL